MQKLSVISTTLILLGASLFLNSAFAGDIEWSGVYRFEGNYLKNSDFEGRREISYGLNHLVLRPKITAGDGFNIFGQFDIFPPFI